MEDSSVCTDVFKDAKFEYKESTDEYVAQYD